MNNSAEPLFSSPQHTVTGTWLAEHNMVLYEPEEKEPLLLLDKYKQSLRDAQLRISKPKDLWPGKSDFFPPPSTRSGIAHTVRIVLCFA